MVRSGFFITGTDTGVGKTVFTSAFVRALRDAGVPVAAYKPACSGMVHPPARSASKGLGEDPLLAQRASVRPFWSDVELLYAATNAAFPRERLCPQTFLAPLSPPAAAALEGRGVDEALLVEGYRWLAERADLVLVEGAGGFYSPISTNWLNADLAERIGLPVLIVAPNRLGTINQTLLTIEAIRQRGLTVAGVILNRMSEAVNASTATNAVEIQQRGRVRIWGEIPFSQRPELQPSRLPESMVCELRRFGTEVDG